MNKPTIAVEREQPGRGAGNSDRASVVTAARCTLRADPKDGGTRPFSLGNHLRNGGRRLRPAGGKGVAVRVDHGADTPRVKNLRSGGT